MTKQTVKGKMTICDIPTYTKERVRAISTARLYVAVAHLRPINVIVYDGPQWRSNLGAGFALRCFQRLSEPDVATGLCTWRYNPWTSGPSNTVLSY